MSQHAKALAATLHVLLLACAGAGEPASPPRAEPARSGHGYALLYEILGQEKNVSQLLVIKEDREAFGAVIGGIAETCGAAHERLAELAERSPRLDLSDNGLPAEERRTRELIQETRRDLLLASSGRELELQLLLIQSEALTYAAHLADALSRSESDPERSAFLKTLWKDLTKHLHDVQALLRGGRRPTG
jgi:hypothetical protein